MTIEDADKLNGHNRRLLYIHKQRESEYRSCLYNEPRRYYKFKVPLKKLFLKYGVYFCVEVSFFNVFEKV